MESTPSKRWTTMQAYVLAAICLAVGVTAGYLFAGSQPAQEPIRPTAAEAPAPGAGTPPHAMPTSEQMKVMAEKAAAPVIAELEAKPDSPELLAKAASLYFRGGQYRLSAEYYERAVKAKPNAEWFVSLSNAYHFAGDDQSAMNSLEAALRVDPNSANALFNLGVYTLREKKDAKSAIGYWNRLLKAHPKHPGREQVERMIAQASGVTSAAANAGQ